MGYNPKLAHGGVVGVIRVRGGDRYQKSFAIFSKTSAHASHLGCNVWDPLVAFAFAWGLYVEDFPAVKGMLYGVQLFVILII